MNDIKTVKSVEVTELKLLSSLKSDKLKGKKILQLFQQDLLPGTHGRIVEKSTNKTKDEAYPISKWIKTFAWSFLVILNAGLIFYVFLFGVN